MSNLDQAAEQFEADMAKLLRPIHRDGSGKPQPIDTTKLLVERGKTHGDYSVHARITQALKSTIGNFHIVGPASDVPHPAADKLNPEQAEALAMIFHKIGRILAGDPDFRDHWDDIAGYAKLVADRCSK